MTAARSARAPARAGAVAAAAALALALVAAPASAATWTFASDSPLLLGGSISGQFSAADTDADQFISASEVTAFSVSYAGAPPATSSFSINKSTLDFGDSFGFDLLGGSFSFGVLDSAGQGISGGNQQFSTVLASGFYDAGGMLNISAVPEPTALSMWTGALALFGFAGLRSRSARSAVRRRTGPRR